jgi:DNA gyrase subunit A
MPRVKLKIQHLLTQKKEGRQAGFEVIYTDTQKPEAIVASAIQESVDHIGITTLPGADLGNIKKTKLDAYSNPRKAGIIAIGLKEGDELIGASLTTGQDLVILATRDGMAIKFNEDDVRAMGRPAAGVTSMRLKGDDYIIGKAGRETGSLS